MQDRASRVAFPRISRTGWILLSLAAFCFVCAYAFARPASAADADTIDLPGIASALSAEAASEWEKANHIEVAGLTGTIYDLAAAVEATKVTFCFHAMRAQSLFYAAYALSDSIPASEDEVTVGGRKAKSAPLPDLVGEINKGLKANKCGLNKQ